MVKRPFARATLLAAASMALVCAEAAVATRAPGWTFLETESPVFRTGGGAARNACVVRDWRGRGAAVGDVAADGSVSLAPLPPGYYRGTVGDDSFTFCVVTTNRCRSADSFFAVDSALSGCSRRGSYDCPWYGGDCWHVTAELLGKCGVAHTRERLEWGPFIEPKKGKRDFSRYMASARAMKENGVVSTGIFHDAPRWLKRPGKRFPDDLAYLYRFMEDAARTFDPYYDSWEFWNEQELDSAPVWEYVAALKAFALGARAGSATTVILPGSISSIQHFGYAQAMFDSDIAKYVQALNLHTYVPVAGYNAFHADIRKFLAEAGVPDWQVWLTESGTNLEGNGKAKGSRKGLMAHSAEQEMVIAEFFPKSAILHQQGGIFRNWFFLFGCYNEQAGCRDWGTMRRDGTVKPVHAAISAVTSELGDARLLGEKRLGDGLRGFVYAKPDGSRTLAFWSRSNLDRANGPVVGIDSLCERKVEIPAAGGEYRLTDLMGTPSRVKAEGGRLALTATRYPQYLSGLRGVAADVRPANPGRLAKYVAADDEDLTVVIRPETATNDFTVSGGSCVAELCKEKGRMRIEVWNLSSVPKRGRIAVSKGRLEGGDGELSIAPWGRAVVDALYVPPAGELNFAADFSGVFNGKRSSRIRVPMFNAFKFLSDGEVVTLPQLDSPSAWKRNDSGSKYSCTYDEREKSVRFDVEWDKSSGVWFFPVHEFAPGESFKGARYMEFEVKNQQDKVESDMFCVEVMCLYGKGRNHKSARFKSPGMHWERRRVMLPPDAGEMTGFRVGGLIHGHKLSYWIRNFRIIKEKSSHDLNVCDFGASVDAAPAANANAIQKAIDTASMAGGGRVVVPAGTFMSATLWLKPNVELYLAKGSVLKASDDMADYNDEDAYPENWGAPSEQWRGLHFIIARMADGASIAGEGTLHGNGDAFYEDEPKAYRPWMKPGAAAWWNGIRWSRDKQNLRPGQMVVFLKCRNVSVRGITIRNSPCWSLWFWGCDGVRVSDYTVRNGENDGNSDGIDIDCSRNVVLERMDIDTGDDAVAIRASARSHSADGKGRLGLPAVTENVRIRDCRLRSTSSVVRIGVGEGVIRDVEFDGVTCDRGGTAVSISTLYGDEARGGTDIERIVVRNSRFANCRSGAVVRSNGGAHLEFGIRDILFENCSFGGHSPVVKSLPGVRFPIPENGVRFVPRAATPKSCIGMKRSWDPYPGWWERRHEEKLAEIAASGGEIDLVFVGDSITHNWEGARGPGSAYGGKPLAELKKTYSVLNLGFGGDTTRNVLWRLENGELDGYKAKCVMLMIGTNNGGTSAEDTAAGVKTILDLIARKQPQAVTILLPIFPSGATAGHPWRTSKEKVNALIRKFADGKKVVWHDFNSRFLNPDGTFQNGMMMKDDLHPLAPGYEIWAEEVAPIFRKVCGK